MKEIKFELKIEKSYEGSCPLEDLLNWLGITEEKWNSFTTLAQESIIRCYYEGVVHNIDRNCDNMNYYIEIKK